SKYGGRMAKTELLRRDPTIRLGGMIVVAIGVIPSRRSASCRRIHGDGSLLLTQGRVMLRPLARRSMAEERVERRLAAILAAEAAGWWGLMGADEEGTLAALKAIRRELGEPKIDEHRGRVVKTTGDGLLVEFPSVVDAVRFAVEMQRGMAARNAAIAADKRIEFRIGINLGDIIIDDGDIYGDGVNVAARLEALAEPGGICVSRVVREEVRDRLEVAFDDLGEQQVKNIARPVRVYRIRPLPDPPLHAGEGGARSARVGTSARLALPDKPSLA